MVIFIKMFEVPKKAENITGGGGGRGDKNREDKQPKLTWNYKSTGKKESRSINEALERNR
jgi:hypothetical protein